MFSTGEWMPTNWPMFCRRKTTSSATVSRKLKVENALVPSQVGTMLARILNAPALFICFTVCSLANLAATPPTVITSFRLHGSFPLHLNSFALTSTINYLYLSSIISLSTLSSLSSLAIYLSIFSTLRPSPLFAMIAVSFLEDF